MEHLLQILVHILKNQKTEESFQGHTSAIKIALKFQINVEK